MRMTRPASYEETAALLPKYMRPGLLTNLSDPKALQGDRLEIDERDNGLFILREREGFSLLTFLMTGGPVPPLPGRILTELVLRPGEEPGFREALFEGAGFRKRLDRVRLSRPAGPFHELPASPVRAAGAAELEPVEALMRTALDPLTGCLPKKDELAGDLSAGHVLAAAVQGRVAGVLRFTRGAGRAEIRQMAVAEECRGRGLAGALTAAFLGKFAGTRCFVWTGSENRAALAVYKKRGFSVDGYRSAVMIKE